MKLADARKHYVTAKIKADCCTHLWGIPPNEYVSVKYSHDAYNAYTKQEDCIYLIRATLGEDWRGHVFASTLDSFCL